MAGITADQIGQTITPYLNSAVNWIYFIGEILLLVGLLVYGMMFFLFNVKVIIYEYTRGGKVIIKQTKAREIKNKVTQIPELQFRDATIFWGKRINSPPNECAFSYKGGITKKVYSLILKDGMYYPIANQVLGKKYIIPSKDENAVPTDKFLELQKFCSEKGLVLANPTINPHIEVYSTEGSGLEVSRNYDHEQAIINKLHQSAIQFRNKKPVEMVAMYGLMCIVIIGSIVIIVYSLKKVGDLFVTLQSLGTPIHEAVKAAVIQKLGPG